MNKNNDMKQHMLSIEISVLIFLMFSLQIISLHFIFK